MSLVVPIVIALLALTILYTTHRFYYDYEITSKSLIVTWFGIRIRRLPLTEIESISKRRRNAAENWANTWRPRHRILVIRKRRGMLKDFVITPRYRYEFRNQLEDAMHALPSDHTT